MTVSEYMSTVACTSGIENTCPRTPAWNRLYVPVSLLMVIARSSIAVGVSHCFASSKAACRTRSGGDDVPVLVPDDHAAGEEREVRDLRERLDDHVVLRDVPEDRDPRGERAAEHFLPVPGDERDAARVLQRLLNAGSHRDEPFARVVRDVREAAAAVLRARSSPIVNRNPPTISCVVRCSWGCPSIVNSHVAVNTSKSAVSRLVSV